MNDGRVKPFGVADWAELAFSELGALPDVARVGLALVEGGGRRLLFASSDRTGIDVPWCHIDVFEKVPLNDALGGGTPVAGSLDELQASYPSFVARQREEGHVALAAIPLKASNHLLGGYLLYYSEAVTFTPQLLTELEERADRLAMGLDTALRRPGPSLPDYIRPENSLVAANDYPPDYASVGKARQFLREKLTGWAVDGDVVESAALCLTELATNALIHARSGFCIQIELQEQVLRVEVHDLGGEVQLRPAPELDRDIPHGRGLQIVQALSSRWGQVNGPDRSVVWFALDLGSAP